MKCEILVPARFTMVCNLACQLADKSVRTTHTHACLRFLKMRIQPSLSPPPPSFVRCHFCIAGGSGQHGITKLLWYALILSFSISLLRDYALQIQQVCRGLRYERLSTSPSLSHSPIIHSWLILFIPFGRRHSVAQAPRGPYQKTTDNSRQN